MKEFIACLSYIPKGTNNIKVIIRKIIAPNRGHAGAWFEEDEEIVHLKRTEITGVFDLKIREIEQIKTIK